MEQTSFKQVANPLHDPHGIDLTTAISTVQVQKQSSERMINVHTEDVRGVTSKHRKIAGKGLSSSASERVII